jgi:uncharacterized protein YraI
MKYNRTLVGFAFAAASLIGSMSTASAQQLYNVRSGPGFNYEIKYQITSGTALSIKCHTNDAAGNMWYQLADNNYVLASSVNTSVAYPKCVGIGW